MRNKTFESVPLLKVAICLMVGIVVREYVVVPLPLLPVLAGLVVVALLLWRYEHLQSVTIAGCFIVLGMLLTERQKASLHIVWPEGEVCFEAVVLTEPIEKPKTMAVDILLPTSHQQLKCYLYKDQRSRGLTVGDGLRIQSRIRSDSQSVRTFVASWKWQKVRLSLKDLSRLERTRLWFLRLRSRLLRRLGDRMDHEAYAVIAAMTLGDKSALTRELKETYAVTGASHILALSGLHLGIIYMLLSFLVMGRRWQMMSQLLVILGIWMFVFLVGLSISVVRSAVMLTVYALLSLGHRDRMSVNTLAFTAIVMLMLSPLTLFDVGFQMSYMSVFSILLFMPLSERVFSQQYMMSHRLIRWLWGMVSVSCSAQIGVAPLIAYYFGRFSTFFLLTNFIVVPTAVLILYLSLVVFLVPSLSFLLYSVVSWLNAILSYIAAIPGASIGGLHPSILQVSMVYVIIMASYLLVCRLLEQQHYQ